MEKGVLRAIQAIESHEKIAVFGDYDVDGATSTSLLVHFFRALGIQIATYIPHREKEGYGPNSAAMTQLREQGVTLVITVDCGTLAFEPLQHANSIGLESIVLDHHIGGDTLPEAMAVVNPNRLDEDSDLNNLAAVGITYLFIAALRQKLRSQKWFETHKIPEPDLLPLLDLVALGTVADVMTLTRLNRAFVTQGLKVMSHTQNIGLKALLDVSQVQGDLDAYHCGFILGPRINAAGRIDDAALGTKLLTTESYDEARKIAEHLDALNQERRVIEKEILAQAEALVTNDDLAQPFLIVSGHKWPVGVLGLVAGRLKEKYNLPTLAICFDEDGNGKGSGRSISEIDMGTLIHQAVEAKIIDGGGGHAMAAGIALKQEQLLPFKEFLQNRLKGQKFQKTLNVDISLSISGVTHELIQQVEQLAPFGMGNPRPKLRLKNVRVAFKKIVGEKHLKCVLESENGHRLPAIAFQAMDQDLGPLLLKLDQKFYDVLGTANLNHWNGNTTVQFILEDIST